MNVVSVLLGIVAIASAGVFLGAWILMLILGTLAGYHDWYSPGFWETFLALWGTAIVGSAFNGSKLKNSGE